MHKLNILLQFAFFLALTGCGDNIQRLHDEVMVIHDQVMPRMGEMHQLRVKLESRMTGLDSVAALPYVSAIHELKRGEDLMWDWMDAYKKPETSTSESVSYLHQQKEAISVVATAMTTAIDQANALLQ